MEGFQIGSQLGRLLGIGGPVGRFEELSGIEGLFVVAGFDGTIEAAAATTRQRQQQQCDEQRRQYLQ